VNTELEMRLAAARDSDWEHPPIRQEATRQLIPGERHLRVGVTWPNAPADVDAHVRMAQAAERGGVDFVLMPDGWVDERRGVSDNGLRSVLWSVPVVLATDRLGVVSAMRTSFTAPFHIARFGSHLDWLSKGRWAWCVTTGSGDAAARLYGRAAMPDVATRYAMADDVVRAVAAIWAGAESGVDYDGPFVSVHGTSKRPFTTQKPRPPLFGVGNSPQAIALAGSLLDVWVATDGSADGLAATRSGLRAAAASADRERPRQYLELSADDRGLLHAQGASFGPGTAIADELATLYEAGLVEGLLVRLSDGEGAPLEAVTALVAELEQRGVLELASARAARW
jgi:alkanesulfonate monooxygenase SsuD/methylene tetrahydromethanopterin reductase-like flavin-dependent oxidoreductase (luciferase family)